MIRVQSEDFDIGAEIEALRKGRSDIGAIVSFTGTVREGDGPDALESMTLEHYPGMTEKELARIEAEAHERWPLQASLIVHRYGTLKPGDNIVLVVTASSHRHAAFEAASFLMDYLKSSAPFWKQEKGKQGPRWVASRDSDDAAKARWDKPTAQPKAKPKISAVE
ncbi:molybdenum cofactor biosynthesis protein MoaE [Methyloligella sp. 2.7D]|uniref:molybdenum cofactor biosynthesis protein MoaE n=1 Tax=unclassified Methyloligella TaxID=2625955 RepID=UPI00157D8A6F|nr:molybdenum cofactor biosynthesis protein MoaE [Methyloligella sp. GL2]QKP77047.1 molybdenum cofactor biosynthesis protein MoaE [Methyloligella sp. GL2]